MDNLHKLKRIIEKQNNRLRIKSVIINRLLNNNLELQEFKNSWPLELNVILDKIEKHNINYRELLKVEIPTDGKIKAEKTTIYLDDLIAIHIVGKKKHLYLSKDVKIESDGAMSNLHSTKMDVDEIIKSIDSTNFYMFKIGKSVWINLSYYSHKSINNQKNLVIYLNPNVIIREDIFGKQLMELCIKGKNVDSYLKQRKLFEQYDSFRKLSFRSEFENLLGK